VLGSGFCQTFAVSAKPVALFDAQGCTSGSDWSRLSLLLLLPLWLLLTLFATLVWPWQRLL
jgi:hypothetical protein